MKLFIPNNYIVYPYVINKKLSNIEIEWITECYWHDDRNLYILVLDDVPYSSTPYSAYIPNMPRSSEFEQQFITFPYRRVDMMFFMFQRMKAIESHMFQRMNAIEAQNTIIISHLEAICVSLGTRSVDADPLDSDLKI